MTLVIAILSAPFSVLTLCLAVELFAGLRPLRRETTSATSSRSAVIVVPAHNEQAILGPTLERLTIAASKTARILLVADNCTDMTAEIGRNAGVEVIERSDTDHRGKGFALDFARRHLETNPPEIVLIIDADCTTDARSIDQLIRCCLASRRPCQGTYLLEPRAESSPSVQLSSFAFFVRNVIRQRGLQRLIGRSHMVGTGMAFPWSIYRHADMATDNIVEDLKLGQDLAEAGDAPMFVEHAIVWGRAETETNTLAQRSRWEGGFLGNAVRHAPSLLIRSLARADLRGVWAAVDLMIPPLALLLFLDLLVIGIGAGAVFLAGAQFWPVIVLAVILIASAAGLVFSWWWGGSRFVTLAALAKIPLYVLWKLPLYMRLARVGSPKEWVRTDRGNFQG